MINVLVVEDEQFMRDEIVLTTPWDRFSCRVIDSAENGLEGEEKIRRLKPDLVITDIRMPGQDGITMLKRTECPAAIILTGFGEFSYAREAIRLGVVDYIVKPVDDNDFYAALEKISSRLLKDKDNTAGASAFKEYICPPEMDKQEYYIESAISFIKEHFRDDISLSDAAGAIGITESYLSRLFKARTSYSFLQYLRNHRLKTALTLMNNQSLRINEIARMTGFRDMSYFCSVFRKHIGVTPGQYQNGVRPKGTNPT